MSAVATGWFAVAVASVVGVRLAAPSSGDTAGTLRGLAVGNSIGMLVAGAVLLAAVRRAAGPDALGGIVRTTSVGLLGAVGAAGAGLWAEHRLQGAWGTGAASSAAVGLLAALVAVLVMGAVLLSGDRPLARAVRRRGHPVDRRPVQEDAAGA